MKPGHILTLNFFFCLIACGNKQSAEDTGIININDTTAEITTAGIADSLEPGKIIEHVVCKNDTSQSYALYIPSKFKSEAFPVIYFFDPHAEGALPLKKYKTLADEYSFVLIGSNNSKNGNDWRVTENIWNTLFNDTQSRLIFNRDRIYTCGFSGGAKVASYAALHHSEVKGVIANGAGLPDEAPAGNFNFSFTAIAGEGDMNMTDLIALNDHLDKTQTRHRIIFFDGKHEWAPVTTMNIAFAGLQLDAMHDKFIAKNDSFINQYIADSKKRLDNYSKNLIQAEQECKLSISVINGLTDEVNWFKEKEDSLTNNPVFQKQWRARQNLFHTEQNKKTEYAQQFQQGDMNYWVKTINGLQTNAKAHTAEGAMYQRLVAYLSLAFYSVSNQLINSDQNKEAEYFVALYKMADPANSEAWYFSAILNARNNNSKAVEDDLLKAVKNGFTDKSRMMQQPEFKNLSTQINFPGIESKMKKEE